MSKSGLGVFANDDGHFNNKGARFVNGQVKKIISPTIITRSKAGFDALGSSSANTYSTENQIGAQVKEQSYTVLDEIIPGQSNSFIDTNKESYQVSAPARVMVNHMMRQLGSTPSDKIILVTSSPIERFYKDGIRNEDYIKERELMMSKPVYLDGQNEPMHQIVKHIEIAESLGAFYNDAIKYTFNKNKLRLSMDQAIVDQSSLYIDIGGRTIDTGVIQNKAIISADCHTFEDSGMLAIHDKIRISLKPYRQNISRLEIDEIIRTKQFIPDLREARSINVEDIVVKAIEEVLENAIGDILDSYNFKDFNRVRFTGGSSSILAPFIKRYVSDVSFSDTPLYDNVLGMLKFGELERIKLERELKAA
jgi:hypothetical protein